MTGEELFNVWRRYMNGESSGLGIEYWHRQSVKRRRAWEKTAEEVSRGIGTHQ